MFQVRATVVGFLGDLSVYPCHFGSQVGDQVVFDGAELHGRFCPAVWAVVVPKMMTMHAAGPRYVEPASYYPFWYAANSVVDPGCAPRDGQGLRNVLESIEPPPFDMARLQPPGAFRWPPSDKPGIAAAPTIICPDSRSSMVLALEAFDLSEKGFDTPYFRRQMAILAKLARSGPVQAEAIIGLFTRQEAEEIYPPLSPVMVAMLVEELQLLDYVGKPGADGLSAITPAGEAKLGSFKAGLPPDHLRAFEDYT